MAFIKIQYAHIFFQIAFIFIAMCNTQQVFYKRSKSITVFKLKTQIPSTKPCHIRKISQQFSVDNGPYVSVNLNVCSGSCFSKNVPSNSTIVKSLCRSCQITKHAFEMVKFPLADGNFTKIQVKTALKCECKNCIAN